MKYLIQSFGFSQYEQKLLGEQLRVLSLRLRCEWQYKGEGRSAHVVLSRRRLKLAESQMQVLVFDSNDRYSIGSLVEKSGMYVLEMPLRILGLYDILVLAEGKDLRLPLDRSASSTKHLSGMIVDSASRLGDGFLGVLDSPEQLVVFQNMGNQQMLVRSASDLDATVGELFPVDIDDPAVSFDVLPDSSILPNFEFEFPFGRFLWRLAFSETPTEQEKLFWKSKRILVDSNQAEALFDGDASIWPLKELFGESPLSVSEAVAAGIEENTVLGFLQACSVTKAGMSLSNL